MSKKSFASTTHIWPLERLRQEVTGQKINDDTFDRIAWTAYMCSKDFEEICILQILSELKIKRESPVSKPEVQPCSED